MTWQTTPTVLAAADAAAKPAGGAALDQVVLATGAAAAGLAGLFWLIARHRAGRAPRFERAIAHAERVSGLPGWAAIPTALAGIALMTALVGMYWDISLHVDNGRDEGPLANPAHYLILVGLFGVFSAGVLAMAMPRENPGRASVAIGPGWHAPVGGLLMAACGAFALAGFPLDDVWHRLFGQDVTLWGPTHLMLIGGAGMTLLGQAVLLQEGVRARTAAPRGERAGFFARYAMARQVALMGGLLIGLSTFQAEFDFGIPQFRAVLQPALIALAAGVALVAARVWIGPGGAVGAVVFFLVVRGLVSLLVGPILGQTTPSLPLYVGEALAVEGAALLLARRGGVIAAGVAGGFLAGTVGFATEFAWTQVAFRLPWETGLLPEALVVAAVAGTAGGALGALIGLALRAELPRPAVARGIAITASVALVAVVANGLYETTPSVRATVTTAPSDRPGALDVGVRLDPPDAAEDAAWLNVTAWQGKGLVVDRLVPDGDGGWRSTQPIPADGTWKVYVRLHRDRAVLAAPVRLPADPAIPAPELAPAARAEHTLAPDRELLQRERKTDVAGWLWGGASAVVLLLAAGFLGALAWGLGRVARTDKPPPPGPPRLTLDSSVRVGARSRPSLPR